MSCSKKTGITEGRRSKGIISILGATRIYVKQSTKKKSYNGENFYGHKDLVTISEKKEEKSALRKRTYEHLKTGEVGYGGELVTLTERWGTIKIGENGD